LRKAIGLKKAGGPAPEIHGVDDGFRDVHDFVFTEQTGKFGDLAAHRLDIWRV
jgi:hypothetical protein